MIAWQNFSGVFYSIYEEEDVNELILVAESGDHTLSNLNEAKTLMMKLDDRKNNQIFNHLKSWDSSLKFRFWR